MVDDDANIMAERYYLLGGRNRRPHLCLHHFVQLVGKQPIHNHPTPVCSIILKGGYTEVIDEDEIRFRSVGSVTALSSKQFHSIVSLTPHTWTLFLCGWYTNGFYIKEPGREPQLFRNVGDLTKGAWMQVTPELQAKLDRKRRALAKIRTITVRTVSP
jgi:hypothetical protein